ncbi:class D sortase [Pseudoneobacillus sp. C159]
MKVFIAIGCMITGILCLAYPKLMEKIHNQQQTEILQVWEPNTIGMIDESAIIPKALKKNFIELDRVLINEPVELAAEEETIQTQTPTPKQTVQKQLPSKMVGVISISKIKVTLPILEGTSKKVLDVAAGHLEGSVLPGKSGNSAIAAHRSRTYGRMFNRLGEMKLGDEITVETKNGSFRYVVFKKLIVTPDDLSVLRNYGDEKVITLITCHPVKNPTHRLIIQAKMS